MRLADTLFLGIDVSGSAPQWRARCSRPTTWIATLAASDADALLLADLRPVQDLPGRGEPFERMATMLRVGDFVAAGIDAPFSIPTRFLPDGGQPELLRRVARLPVPSGRPFVHGRDLLELAWLVAPRDGAKPLRDTERRWSARGINTRSTLWNGLRGGAPFTVACLTLLARAERPIWPWESGQGMLVEAFPAAQFRCWTLLHSGYAGEGQTNARAYSRRSRRTAAVRSRPARPDAALCGCARCHAAPIYVLDPSYR